MLNLKKGLFACTVVMMAACGIKDNSAPTISEQEFNNDQKEYNESKEVFTNYHNAGIRGDEAGLKILSAEQKATVKDISISGVNAILRNLNGMTQKFEKTLSTLVLIFDHNISMAEKLEKRYSKGQSVKKADGSVVVMQLEKPDEFKKYIKDLKEKRSQYVKIIDDAKNEKLNQKIQNAMNDLTHLLELQKFFESTKISEVSILSNTVWAERLPEDPTKLEVNNLGGKLLQFYQTEGKQRILLGENDEKTQKRLFYKTALLRVKADSTTSGTLELLWDNPNENAQATIYSFIIESQGATKTIRIDYKAGEIVPTGVDGHKLNFAFKRQ